MADDTAASPDGEDWTGKATDLIESVVETVRTKTVLPLTKVARIVVFGLIIGVTALALLIVFIVALVRVINVYLPVHPHARAVWITYAGLGAIFVLGGAFAMRKRTVRPH